MKKSKDLCSGCYNNDYNHGLGGSKECWSFSWARVIQRIPIHVDQPPPYDKKKAKPMLNCYQEKRMCFPSPDALTDKGFWK